MSARELDSEQTARLQALVDRDSGFGARLEAVKTEVVKDLVRDKLSDEPRP